MTANLHFASLKTLVEICNTLDPEANVKASAFSTKAKAVARVEKIAAAKGVDLNQLYRFDEAGINMVEVNKAVETTLAQLDTQMAKAAAAYINEQKATDDLEPPYEAPVDEDEPEEQPKPSGLLGALVSQMNGEAAPVTPPAEQQKPAAAKAPKEKKEKPLSVRAFSEPLLLEVVSVDEKGRKIGHSYEDILAKVYERFPEAKTSVACLRWYAVHLRHDGTEVPARPKVAKAAAETK